MRHGLGKRVATRAIGLSLLKAGTRLAAGICALGFSLAAVEALDRGVSPAVLNAPESVHAFPTPVALIEDVTRQVYRILVDVEGAIKGGTAFLVSGNRIIATNHHVIEKGTAFSVGYVGENGIIKRIPLRVIAVFPQKDLALLEALDDLPGHPLPLSTQHPGPATDLFAIGFPAAADPQGGLSWSRGDDETFFLPSVLKGYVSRVLTNRWFSSQLQHQTPIIPGYSGGPLVDNDGIVVGISTSIHKEANGISYAVLASDLAEFVSACALPLPGGAAVPRPAPTQRSSGQAPAVLNTHSIQKTMAHAPEDRAMLERGNRLLEGGDIVAARLMFRYLANHRNLAEAYAGLAKTYDPVFLHSQNVLGVPGDAAKAEEFYQQAEKLGAAKATMRAVRASARLGGRCEDSLCKLVSSANGPTVMCEYTDPKTARR